MASLTKIGNWVSQQLATLEWWDLHRPGVRILLPHRPLLTLLIRVPHGTGPRRLYRPITRLISFAEGLLDGIVAFIKEAILKAWHLWPKARRMGAVDRRVGQESHHRRRGAQTAENLICLHDAVRTRKRSGRTSRKPTRWPLLGIGSRFLSRF